MARYSECWSRTRLRERAKILKNMKPPGYYKLPIHLADSLNDAAFHSGPESLVPAFAELLEQDPFHAVFVHEPGHSFSRGVQFGGVELEQHGFVPARLEYQSWLVRRFPAGLCRGEERRPVPISGRCRPFSRAHRAFAVAGRTCPACAMRPMHMTETFQPSATPGRSTSRNSRLPHRDSQTELPARTHA